MRHDGDPHADLEDPDFPLRRALQRIMTVFRFARTVGPKKWSAGGTVGCGPCVISMCETA